MHWRVSFLAVEVASIEGGVVLIPNIPTDQGSINGSRQMFLFLSVVHRPDIRRDGSRFSRDHACGLGLFARLALNGRESVTALMDRMIGVASNEL